MTVSAPDKVALVKPGGDGAVAAEVAEGALDGLAPLVSGGVEGRRQGRPRRRGDRTSPPGDGTSRSPGVPGDRLSAYREKRERDHTPEPVPGQGPLPRGNNDTFVIQEHHARRLHWDFRLERDGVLVSWALPRGLPQDPAANRLAVRTEDHPLEYASFEGEIPPGQYGAGTVRIWDRGTYETEKWTDEEIKVVIHGSRISGRYVLIHTGDNRWLMHRMAPVAVPDQPDA